MKKCSSCGATYNDSTNFCSSCGTRLTAVSAQRSRHPGHKKKHHRLVGRLAVPVFHDGANYHFEIGKGEQLTEGSDIAIVATGLMVNEARKAAETLAAEGIHARVINIHTIKPLDEDIILKAARECGKIVTAEEHNVIGGLGEAVCSLLSEKLPTPIRRVGVQDKFGCSGPAWDLLKEYGLDAATICKTAKEMLGR